jgi:hypothetical protein
MRKKQIDIYFILYLAALVILFSNKDAPSNTKNEPVIHNNMELPFRIKVEKPLLTCKIMIDEGGNKYVSLDSLNYIWDYGDVSDVHYEFIVEDQDYHQRMPLSTASKYFTFTEDKDNRMVVFRWQPDNSVVQDRTFNVYITATAVGNNVTNNSPLIARGQFSLVVTNITDIQENVPQSTQFADNAVEHSVPLVPSNTPVPNPVYFSGGDFSIKPQNTRIKGIASQEWNNEIQCYGFSPKQNLSKAPIVRIENSQDGNGGKVSETIIRDNSILLKGKVPDFGHSKVTITLVRNGDLKETTTSFDIIPLTFGAAECPSKMYPYIDYEFVPNLPSDLDNISIYIKESNKQEVRYSTFQNSPFKFKVEASDIGKTLSFERYLNGSLLGKKYYIKVYDFPEPIITRISQQSKNEVILEVTSFGIANGRDNDVKELKLSGNAKWTQLYGRTRLQKSQLEFYEQFSITPIDASKPFAFEAVAIDQRGVSSKSKSFSLN